MRSLWWVGAIIGTVACGGSDRTGLGLVGGSSDAAPDVGGSAGGRTSAGGATGAATGGATDNAGGRVDGGASAGGTDNTGGRGAGGAATGGADNTSGTDGGTDNTGGRGAGGGDNTGGRVGDAGVGGPYEGAHACVVEGDCVAFCGGYGVKGCAGGFCSCSATSCTFASHDGCPPGMVCAGVSGTTCTAAICDPDVGSCVGSREKCCSDALRIFDGREWGYCAKSCP